MRKRLIGVAFVGLAGLIAVLERIEDQPLATAAAGAVPTLMQSDALTRLPLRFEPNRGQAPEATRFVARAPGMVLLLEGNRAEMRLQGAGTRGARVQLELAGARPDPNLVAEDVQPGLSHYLLGDAPAGWVTHVRQFARVRYREVYPGVDLVWYGNPRQLEHDFVLAPGADPAAIRMRYAGVESLAVDERGDLIARTAGGQIVQRAPVAWQDIGGERVPVAAEYRLDPGAHEVALALGPYDREQPLTIDPVIDAGSYFGGPGAESGGPVTVDADGNVILTGTLQPVATDPGAFPTTPGAFDRSYNGGSYDLFVAKFSPDLSTLIYSTFIGGSDYEFPIDAVVTPAGELLLGGVTQSTDFPVVDAAQPVAARNGEGFALLLAADGSALRFSTYLGNDGSNSVDAVGLMPGGDFVLAGLGALPFAQSPGTIGTQSIGPAFTSETFFLLRLAPDGSVRLHTRSNTQRLQVRDLAVDPDGNLAIVGDHSASFEPLGFARINATQSAVDGDNGFFMRVNPTFDAVDMLTPLGGPGYDGASRVLLDADNLPIAAGATRSAPGLFPRGDMFGPPAAAGGGGGVLNGYVQRVLDGRGGQFGLGSDIESLNGAALGNTGFLALTRSDQLPPPDFAPLPGSSASPPSVLAWQLDLRTGRERIADAWYYGGAGFDFAGNAAQAKDGALIVAGQTLAAPVPPGGAQPTHSGESDAVVLRVRQTAPGCEIGMGLIDYYAFERAGITRVRVLRYGSLEQAATVRLRTADLSAKAGQDFLPVDVVLSFEPGRDLPSELVDLDGDGRLDDIEINLVDDAVAEPEEKFGLFLRDAVGCRLAKSGEDGQIAGITDDDAPVSVPCTTPAPPAKADGDTRLPLAGSTPNSCVLVTREDLGNVAGSPATIRIPLERSGSTASAASVKLSVLPSTAEIGAGKDFAGVPSGTLTIPAGSASGAIDLSILNNTRREDPKSLMLRIEDLDLPTVRGGYQDIEIVQVDDDDPALAGSGSLQWFNPRLSLREDSPLAYVSVQRTGGLGGAVSVDWHTVDGTARAGVDYLARSGTLRFPDGIGGTQRLAIPILDNAIVEAAPRDFGIVLEGPLGGATLGERTSMVVEIANNDVPPPAVEQVQFGSASYSVGESAGSVTVSVTRTGTGAGAVSVPYAVTNGTAFAPLDYSAANGTLSWAAGDLAPKTFTIAIVDDPNLEPAETVNLALGTPVGAERGTPASATLTITDNELPGSLQFAVSGYTVNERDAALTVTVTRSGGTGGEASVNFGTENGSALAGGDYTAVGGVLTWPDGDAAPRTFTVSLVDDVRFEPQETLRLILSAASGASLGTPANILATIVDNDVQRRGRLVLSQSAYRFREQGGGNPSVFVDRIGGSDGAASVRVRAVPGTARPPADYAADAVTFNWTDGDASPRRFDVEVFLDGAVDPEETFTLELADATGAALGTPSSATVTITDFDTAPDRTPDAFTIPPPADLPADGSVAPGAIITSGEIRVGGLGPGEEVPLTIRSGSQKAAGSASYSINGKPFRQSEGRVGNGDRVRVRLRASTEPGATTTATLTIGDVSASFSVRTASELEVNSGGAFAPALLLLLAPWLRRRSVARQDPPPGPA